MVCPNCGNVSDGKRFCTQLRATVEQLLIAERHSSLGRMSAAIVHEIRNPLGAIKGAAEALESSVPGTRKEFLDIIKLESDRLNGLVTDFFCGLRARVRRRCCSLPRMK